MRSKLARFWEATIAPQRDARRYLPAHSLLWVGLAVVASVGFREGLGRLVSTSVGDVSWAARLREYGAVLELWGRFPATGSGLGTFRDQVLTIDYQTQRLVLRGAEGPRDVPKKVPESKAPGK